MLITGEPKAVASAYIKARGSIQSIMLKDAKAVYGKYVTLASILEAVTPILSSNGLVLMQEATTNDYGVAIATSILHESGASIDFGPLTMPIADRKPQSVGSAITYARRYALTAVLGLAGDDDDGQAAQDSFKAKPKTAPMGQPEPVDDGLRPAGDDSLFDTPASHAKKPDTLSQAQLTRLNIVGSELYGKEWNIQRPKLCEWVSKGAVNSSKELSRDEADILIRGMEKKIKEVKQAAPIAEPA